MVGITQFQACLQRCRTDGDVVRLTDWRPNFFGAYEVRVDSPELFKASLEARLLAEQPACDIARRLCMRPGAVVRYERLFYNIEDRLDAIHWINLRVLGNTKNGTTEHEDRGARVCSPDGNTLPDARPGGTDGRAGCERPGR
jgi:hypothetical protein